MSHKYPCVYYDNGKCQKFSDNQYSAWCDFDQCEHITPSNGDRIRAMSDEELARYFNTSNMCGVIQRLSLGWCTSRASCLYCFSEWLKSPYKEDT